MVCVDVVCVNGGVQFGEDNQTRSSQASMLARWGRGGGSHGVSPNPAILAAARASCQAWTVQDGGDPIESVAIFV